MPVQVLPTTTNHWKMLTNTTDSSLDQNQVKEMLNQKFPICICKNFCKGWTWLPGTCAPQETLMKVCCWPISCEKWPPPPPPVTLQKWELLVGTASQSQRGCLSPSLTLAHTPAVCPAPLSSSFSFASPCPQVGVEVPLIKRVNNVSGDQIWQMGNKPGLGNNVKSVIPEVLWQQNTQRAASASLLGWRMCETQFSVIILGLQWTESWCWN